MRKSPTLSPRKCEQCGAEYLPSGPTQRFCEPCGKLRDSERKRAYYERTFPNRKPKVKRADPCCVCGGEFSCEYNGKPYCNKHYLRMYAHGDAELHPRARTNTYATNGDETIVTTSNGRSFTVDTADLEKVKQHSWCFCKTGYLVANVDGKVVKLHRYLLDPPPHAVVDHINGNPADNRRSNLRICTAAGNARNSAPKGSKTGHRGVRISPNGRYEARICFERRNISLGTFDTLAEAIEARREGECRYFGEFAPASSRE